MSDLDFIRVRHMADLGDMGHISVALEQQPRSLRKDPWSPMDCRWRRCIIARQ